MIKFTIHVACKHGRFLASFQCLFCNFIYWLFHCCGLTQYSHFIIQYCSDSGQPSYMKRCKEAVSHFSNNCHKCTGQPESDKPMLTSCIILLQMHSQIYLSTTASLIIIHRLQTKQPQMLSIVLFSSLQCFL